MTKITVAKDSNELKKFQEQRRKQQEDFRKSPQLLSAAIAEQIRMDNHANEDPINYENGAMHWYQETWGMVRAKVGNFIKLDKPVHVHEYDKFYGDGTLRKEHPYFEVTCPTTGCIAGWADSLAGFPLVFKNWDFSDPEELAEIYQGELLGVEDCYDPIHQRIRGISDVARELLNLDSLQADWLFNGCRHMDEVLWALDEMAGGNFSWRGTDLEDLRAEDKYDDACHCEQCEPV